MRVRTDGLGVGGIAVIIAAGCATVGRGGSTAAPRDGRSDGPPVCINASKCSLPADLSCTARDTRTFNGSTVIADYSDGVSSDGRGPYTPGTDGVLVGHVGLPAVVGAMSPRHLTVNLNNPVPRGRAVPLGIVIDSGAQNPEGVPLEFAIYTQTMNVGNESQSLHGIPLGQSAAAAQINVFFHINGRFHILQMGPQPWLHCHTRTPPVNGNGTSAGTIYRAGPTKWVVDLPAGSVGRLFDVSNLSKATPFAVFDRGLYYVRLRYEIGN